MITDRQWLENMQEITIDTVKQKAIACVRYAYKSYREHLNKNDLFTAGLYLQELRGMGSMLLWIDIIDGKQYNKYCNRVNTLENRLRK